MAELPDEPLASKSESMITRRKPSIWISRVRQSVRSLIRSIRNPNQILNWVLGMPSPSLILFFTFGFYTCILTFTIILMLLSSTNRYSDCFRYSDGSAANLGNIKGKFTVMFALSWTTFSTVGYGNVWPALESDEDDPSEKTCLIVNIVLMTEAFVGTIFAGSCGAFLLGRISQISNEAQVSFSETMVVQFGSGIIDIDDDSDDSYNSLLDTVQEGIEQSARHQSMKGYPPPMLEFRILNNLYDITHGAITDATIECAASFQEDRNANAQIERHPDPYQDDRIILPRKIFQKCPIANYLHPYFKRCWTAAHMLDENSPLLTARMRKRLKKNGGLWPRHLNNAKDIHKVLQFEEIVVSFNGISKHTAVAVHDEKVYDRSDVLIGYEFVNILEKNDDGYIEVIKDSLDDVMSQDGDDEPLPFNYDEHSEETHSAHTSMEPCEVVLGPNDGERHSIIFE